MSHCIVKFISSMMALSDRDRWLKSIASSVRGLLPVLASGDNVDQRTWLFHTPVEYWL